MLKKLFYISATLLVLVATYTIAAHRAQAQSPQQLRWVGDLFFADSQSIYRFGNHWEPLSEHGYPQPPVSVDQVLWYEGQICVTTSGEGFTWSGQWTSKGFFPGGTVNAQSQTWTSVKEKYR